MSSLITEAFSEAPVVLVIGSPQPLVDEVVSLVRQKKMQPLTLSLEEFETLSEKSAPASLYKAFYIVGLRDTSRERPFPRLKVPVVTVEQQLGRGEATLHTAAFPGSSLIICNGKIDEKELARAIFHPRPPARQVLQGEPLPDVLPPRPPRLPPLQPAQTIASPVRQVPLPKIVPPLVSRQPAAAKVPVSTAPLAHIRVVPQSIPRVENRLIKYQETKEKIERQKQSKQYLRPLPQVTEDTTAQVPFSNEQEQLLEQAITRVFGTQRGEEKADRLGEKYQKTVDSRKRTRRRVWLARLTRTVSIVFILLFASWGATAATAFLFEKQLEKNISQEPPSFTATTFQMANILDIQTSFWQKIFGSETWLVPSTLAHALVKQESTLQKIAKTDTQTAQFIAQVLGNGSGQTWQILSSLEDSEKELYQDLSQLQAEISSVDTELLSKKQQEIVKKLTTVLTSQRKAAVTAQQLQLIWPEILAKGGKRTYAIVLQNPQELRGGGGRIESVLLVTLSDGVLTDRQVFDAKALQAKSIGQVPAPDTLLKATGQTTLSFQDLTWSPDFPTSAGLVYAQLQQGLNRSVDGVLTLNVYTLQDILRVLGPIELPDSQEVLTDKNLWDRVLFHSEANLTNPSKSEYLTKVFEHVITKVLTSPQAVQPKILDVLAQGLSEGQIFFVLRNAGELTTLQSLGWIGEVANPSCPPQLNIEQCQLDTIFQVEENVGVNRANAMVDRSTEHFIDFEADAIVHRRVMSFQNDATSNSWPLGAYKASLRWYLPKNAELIEATVNQLPVGIETLTAEDIREKQVWAVPLEVPTQSSVTVELKYKTPRLFTNNFGYAFFDQKQAGTGPEASKVTIQTANLKPTLIAPTPQQQTSQLIFQNIRRQSSFYAVRFR